MSPICIVPMPEAIGSLSRLPSRPRGLIAASGLAPDGSDARWMKHTQPGLLAKDEVVKWLKLVAGPHFDRPAYAVDSR